MAFTIAYNIRAIDQFTDVIKKIHANAIKMDRAIKNHDKNVKFVTATYKDLNAVTAKGAKNMAKMMDGIEEKARKTQKSVDRMTKDFERLGKAGRGVENLGRSMTTRVTLPIAGAGVAAMKFATDFETAMVEVEKVTNATIAKSLSGSIRQMSKEIPLANTALAGIAADAARFGIRGTDNIETFTRSVAMMSIATDMTADQAGTALAKIQTQTGLTAAKTEHLGSAINELSNNYATSSSEIVNAMLRSSAAASNFGLNATQIIGMSAQMNAMSESAERAGTRMRTLFNELQDPSIMEKYAKAIGMSAKQFDAMRKANPQAAIMSLVDAMAQGGNAAENLRSEASMVSVQALTALAKNADATRRAMTMAAQSFDANTSLQKEFAAASGTSAARFMLFKNRIKDVSITIGNKLLPVVLRLMKKLDPLIDMIANASDESINMALKIAGIAAAIGPVIWIAGKLMTAVSLVTGALGSGGLATALMFLTGPVGIAVGAIAGLVAITVYCWDEIKNLRDAISGEVMGALSGLIGKTDSASSAFGGLGSYLRTSVGLVTSLTAPFVKLGLKIGLLPLRWLIKMVQLVSGVIGAASSVVNILGDSFKYAYNWVKQLLGEWLNSSTAGGVILAVFDKIQSAISTVSGYVSDLSNGFLSLFSDASGFFTGLASKVKGAANDQANMANMAFAGAGDAEINGMISQQVDFAAIKGPAAMEGRSVIDVNLNAPAGVVDSVKTRSKNTYAKVNTGQNTP